jgi:hypothetical protein
VLKACWTRSPLSLVPPAYLEKTRGFPVLLEMPAHAPAWRAAGYRDINVIPNPVGQWWFDREWTGEKEQALFVLSGAGTWRGNDPSRFGLEIWEEICREGRTVLGSSLLSCSAELSRRSRTWVVIDSPWS